MTIFLKDLPMCLGKRSERNLLGLLCLSLPIWERRREEGKKKMGLFRSRKGSGGAASRPLPLVPSSEMPTMIVSISLFCFLSLSLFISLSLSLSLSILITSFSLSMWLEDGMRRSTWRDNGTSTTAWPSGRSTELASWWFFCLWCFYCGSDGKQWRLFFMSYCLCRPFRLFWASCFNLYLLIRWIREGAVSLLCFVIWDNC